MKVQNDLKLIESTIKPTSNTKKEVKEGFMEILSKAIDEVNKLQNEAVKAMDGHLKGQGVELHEAVIAVQKADLSLQILSQIKNKVVKAFEELTRIQV